MVQGEIGEGSAVIWKAGVDGNKESMEVLLLSELNVLCCSHKTNSTS